MIFRYNLFSWQNNNSPNQPSAFSSSTSKANCSYCNRTNGRASTWSLAGTRELGEQLEETAIRESKEETGLNIYDLEFINFQQFIYDPAFWKQRHFIFFDYAAKTDSMDVVLNNEAQAYIWIEPKEALEFDLDSYTRTSGGGVFEQNWSRVRLDQFCYY